MSDRFILNFAWFFGVIQILNAALQTASYAHGGNTGWAVLWGAVLVFALAVTVWAIRTIKLELDS